MVEVALEMVLGTLLQQTEVAEEVQLEVITIKVQVIKGMTEEVQVLEVVVVVVVELGKLGSRLSGAPQRPDLVAVQVVLVQQHLMVVRMEVVVVVVVILVGPRLVVLVGQEEVVPVLILVMV